MYYLQLMKFYFRQRFDYLNHIRNLSEGVWDNADAESVDSQESMEIQVTDDKVNMRRPGKYYRNQVGLMNQVQSSKLGILKITKKKGTHTST